MAVSSVSMAKTLFTLRVPIGVCFSVDRTVNVTKVTGSSSEPHPLAIGPE
jgi:hypothetical protein